MVNQQTRTFPGRYDQIYTICRFVLAGAEQAGLDHDQRFQVELACDEACTNVIEHTYAEEDVGNLDVSWEITDHAFLITIQDSGPPFDPQDELAATPLKAVSIEEVPIGGLGLRFIHQLIDEVRYEYVGGNRLTLVKWLPAPPHLPIWQRELTQGIYLVGVQGRLDQTLTPMLEQTLATLLSQQHGRMIVDLSKTIYINSGGLRSLVTAWRKARQQGGDLVLSGLHGRVAEIFEMIGFDKFFRIYEDVPAARAALGKSAGVGE